MLGLNTYYLIECLRFNWLRAAGRRCAALDRCGQWKRVPDLLAEMRDAGLTPDRVTFNTAIAALGTGGQWQLATVMLDEMKAAGLPPDTVEYHFRSPIVLGLAEYRSKCCHICCDDF